MNKRERVTIIIPVYNGIRYLSETINSCINQSYPNIEIIIIDDCSRDNSFSLLIEEEKKNSNIKVFKNNENIGVIATSNKGIRLAKGEKIIILGQDDILQENHIEKMVEEFTKDTSFVYCESDLIDSKGNRILQVNNKLNFFDKLTNKLYFKNIINACGVMFSKTKAIEVGLFEYNKKWRNFGEWLFWLKMSSIGEIKYCNRVKSLYRRHDANITNSFSKNKKIKKLLNEYFLYCLQYSKIHFYKEMNFSEKIFFNLFFYSCVFKSFVL